MLPTRFDARDGATAVGQLVGKAPLGLARCLTAGGKLSTESQTSLVDHVTVSHGDPRPSWIPGGWLADCRRPQGLVADHTANHVGFLMAPGPG